MSQDLVTCIQDELVKLGHSLTSSAESSQQLHAPESAPLPPAGVDPMFHYQEFWRKRQEERPFATRGFEHLEESQSSSEERAKTKVAEIKEHVDKILDLLDQTKLDETEEEQLKRLEDLQRQNEEARVELEQAVQNANKFLQSVAASQRKVAAGALSF